MEWKRLVVGGRVRVRLPGAAGAPVEVVGRLLGRDTGRFLDLGGATARLGDDFRAVVRLDDGTVLLAELDSVVARAD